MKRMLILLVGMMFLFILAGAAEQSGKVSLGALPDQPDEEEDINQELWQFSKQTPYENAKQHIAGERMKDHPSPSAEMVLPNGWRIAPAGRQVEVGRFPHEAVYYVGRIVVLNTGYTNKKSKEAQEISIINSDSGEVVKVLHITSMFPSAQRGLDGDLYISGGISQKISRFNKKFVLVREYPVQGYTAGLAAVDADHLAVALMVSSVDTQGFEKGDYRQGKLVILNTATGKVERETTAGYFPHSVLYQGGKLYVTLLGEDKLKVYDLQLRPVKSLDVGRTPQCICSGKGNLYVVNTGTDNLSVVNTANDTVVSSINMQVLKTSFGSAPTSCVVDKNLIYVTQAATNSVAIFDLVDKKMKGVIPTGWYPTKVFLQGKHLLVLNGKGIHPRRPNIDGPQPIPGKGGTQYVLTLLKGSLSIISKGEISRNQAVYTRRIEDGSPIYSPMQGFKMPIKNIFYIVRENRTYDQVLGDLEKGNGDPYLTLFGREITPNAHKIADEFVTLDNFYANGEISVLGHSFTTSGYASPFLEWLGNEAYSGRYKGYPFGIVPSTTSPAYLWDALDARGVDYRIYGENYYIYTRVYRIICDIFGPGSDLAKKFYAQTMLLAANVERGNSFSRITVPFYGQADTPGDALKLLDKSEFVRPLSLYFCGDDTLAAAIRTNPAFRTRFAEFLSHYPFNYRSWDLAHSDLERAREWKEDFDRQIKSGKCARLHYIWLPNDHTAGTDTDKTHLAPDQLVAQNDAALGLIVETIAKSPIWGESLILVTEDDAQNGPDHVDATRTVALAAGPYVKRNSLIDDRYDQLSMLRTIEILLNVPPLNLNDALAVPMLTIFTERPVNLPYIPAPHSNHLSDGDRILYQDYAKKP